MTDEHLTHVGHAFSPNRWSQSVLYLELRAGETPLATGTGFLANSQRAPTAFLVSNYHVLAGRHSDTDQPLSNSGAVPDTVVVWHPKPTGDARKFSWVAEKYALLREGKPAFAFQPRVDVAVLPIAKRPEQDAHEVWTHGNPSGFHPTEPVHVVGFPLGLPSVGRFPIFVTGHVASEPALDHDGLPIFLIDAATTAGMSGSPVFGRRVREEVHDYFLGIYSGRIDSRLEIGRVWKPSAVNSVIALAAGENDGSLQSRP